MQNPPDMHQGKCLYTLQDAFHKEIRNLEQLGILEETKDVTEWVKQLCDHGEEGSSWFLQDSNWLLQQSRTLYEQEIKDLLGS